MVPIQASFQGGSSSVGRVEGGTLGGGSSFGITMGSSVGGVSWLQWAALAVGLVSLWLVMRRK